MGSPETPLDFQSLERAIASLAKAVSTLPENDLERDGAIQRFEYTFELCWKFIRRSLLALGRARVSASPKPLLRDAHVEGFLTDIDAWFGFLEARNATSHAYRAEAAERVFAVAAKFPPHAQELLRNMRSRVS